MSTPDGWIKMTERKPERGVSIWAYYPAENKYPERVMLFDDTRGLDLQATHWRPAVLPAPPAKELTQREKDGDAYLAWSRSYGWPHWKDDASPAWHAALSYRDGQNREDLAVCSSRIDAATVGGRVVDAIYNLRRRCGLDT